MFKFYIFVALFSSSINHSVLQESECPDDEAITISNRSDEGSSVWLRDDSYVGYLEFCLHYMYNIREKSILLWTPVCGGALWTNNEARVACNQLGYSNTTTLATIGGLCSTSDTISNGVEVVGCSGTEIGLSECQLSTANCNLRAGIICTSLELCSDEICSKFSYCHPTPTCSYCSIPQEFNCICYGECNPPCMNGGSCVYNNTCQCPPYWTGQHCEQSLPPTTDITAHTDNALPTRLQVLYAVIPILISLLIFSIFIGIITVVVISRKRHKRHRRKLNGTTKSENQTIPLSKNELMSDMMPQDSQNNTVDFQDNIAYQDSIQYSNCDEKSKSKTNLMIQNNIITTGDYDLVGAVAEDNLSLEHNHLCPEYAEIQDVPNKKDCATTAMPTNVQEYSELNNAYKEEQKSLTLDRKMKGHQRQLRNYSKLDHGMLCQPRNQYPGETYSILDMSNSESQYHKTEHKPIPSDFVNNNFKQDNAVCKKMPEVIYVETKDEVLSSTDGADERSHSTEISNKGTIINYDHCTLQYNPQYNCNH